MKILQLTPGAGENFYCENCLRDAVFLRALRAEGHDAMGVPLYLPPLDEATGKTSRRREEIFFGGINVYLQQKFSLFRRTPRWLDKLFDARGLLRWAGRKSSMTSAAILGETTLSMLQGQQGRQKKELDRLADFLETERPDVIILSSVLLVGMAATLADRLDCGIVCWMQDEDHFLDALEEPHRSEAWTLMQAGIERADLLLAPSRYFADVMGRRLAIPPEKLAVLREGVDLPDLPADRPAVPTIGFLSQLTRNKGLDELVEALATLRSEPGPLAGTRLVADGGQTGADTPFVKQTRRRIRKLRLDDAVDIRHEFDLRTKQQMLAGVHVLAVPSREPEAYALHALEAMAVGTPVVIPDHGGQAEIVRDTGGGIVYPPGDRAAMTAALRELLSDPARAAEIGRIGRAALEDRYSLPIVARQLVDLCADRVGGKATA